MANAEASAPLLDDTAQKIATLRAWRDGSIITENEFNHQLSVLVAQSGGGGAAPQTVNSAAHFADVTNLLPAAIPVASAVEQGADRDRRKQKRASSSSSRARETASTAGRGQRQDSGGGGVPTLAQLGARGGYGAIAEDAPPAAYVPDHTCLAWFACLCCCWPLGCFAICNANEAQAARARGDLATARRKANSASCYATSAIIVGLLLGIVLPVCYFFWLQPANSGGDGNGQQPTPSPTYYGGGR